MIGILSLFLLGSVYAKSKYNEESLIVDTTQGKIQGFLNSGGARQWKGIPYAQPPMNELRFAYPMPFKSDNTEEPYMANVDVNGCPQHCNLPPGNCPEYGTSEDCLYLSVFSPNEPSDDKDGYPVLFWMHGGAYTQGLGNCDLYDATNFTKKGVVSVVINYRLGALGFMASESMQGNYGFMDQRLAMQWTQDNIAAFGGNPQRVTIAGQSAGAMSVGTHMTSKKSQGLYSQAIMESNPLALPYHTRESATANANAIFTYLGCDIDDVDCVRSKSTEEILDAQDNAIKLNLDELLLNFVPFSPLVEPDGELTIQPLNAMQQGLVPQIPMMMGSLHDEGQLFVYELFSKPLGEKEYNAIVDGVFGLRSSRGILKQYPFETTPVANNTDGRDTLNVLATDLLFYCSLRNATRGMIRDNNKSKFVYRFKHVMSFDCWGENYTFCQGVCCHGSELPFVFTNFGAGDIYYDHTADEDKLATDLSNAWSNFIHSGNPNTGLPIPAEYPVFQIASDELVVLDEPGMEEESHVRLKYCDMWDRNGYFY